MLGIYARTDAERGVFKAPANEVVRGALDVRFEISEGTQDVLNPRGVNCIRVFPGARHSRVGRAHLFHQLTVEVHQCSALFLFLAESIDEGTQWVVFEGNSERACGRASGRPLFSFWE